MDDKNLAMGCVTLMALACLSVEAYGIQVSASTGALIGQVVTGLMGAAVGKALAERNQAAPPKPPVV